jgi:MFS family permease
MTEPGAARPPTRQDMMPALALVVATAVSMVGSQLTLVALPWFVLQATVSPAQTGLTGSFLALAQFISGIVGGAVIDRLGYRRVSIAADLDSGAGIAAIPLLYALGGLAFWQILALVLAVGMTQVGTLRQMDRTA